MEKLKEMCTAEKLRIFACIGMILETIAVVLLQPYHVIPVYGQLWGKILYYIARLIGASALPIFIFLMAEGFHYTHKRQRYFLRVLIFALVSEYPFDMCFYHGIYFFGAQNTMISFAIAFASVWIISRILPVGKEIGRTESRLPDSKPPKPWMSSAGMSAKVIVCVIVCVIACALTVLLKSAFGFGIVLALTGAYFLKDKDRKLEAVVIVGSLCLYLLYLMIFRNASFMMNRMWLSFFGIFSVIPMIFYNGKQGKKPGKYTFYCIYAGHMLLFAYVYGFIFVAR